MFSRNIERFLQELKPSHKIHWSYVTFYSKYITFQFYKDKSIKFDSNIDAASKAMQIFEPIVGFISKNVFINVLDIEAEDGVYIKGYDYLKPEEIEMIEKSADGKYRFDVDHFMKYQFRNCIAEDILLVYLRVLISNRLKVSL